MPNPRYAKHIIEYHLQKLFEMCFSKNQISTITGINIERLISDPAYFNDKAGDHYKILKLLHETDYHKTKEIPETLELIRLPSSFNAYLLNSNNVLDMFEKIRRFTGLSYPDNTFGYYEDETALVFFLKQHPVELQFSTSQGFIFYLIRMIHELLPSSSFELEVGCASSEYPDYATFSRLGCNNVSFNQSFSFVRIPKHLALESIPTYNSRITDFLERQFSCQFPDLAYDSELEDLIYSDILDAIKRGGSSRMFNISFAASRYGLSRATLYRKLHNSNTSFSEIVESIRKSESKRLLLDPFLLLEQVSERLGYSNVSAFSRAFKRWYGQTPASFRGS